MPGVMDPGKDDEVAFSLDYSGTTWGPCGYWDCFAWTRDREFLAWFADLRQVARWWKANRDRNHDGWLEPGVNAAGRRRRSAIAKSQGRSPEIAKLCPEFWDYTGVQYEHFGDASLDLRGAWDDSGRFVVGRHRGLRFDPKTCSLNIHFIETQLYISLLNGFVARRLYQARAERGSEAICGRGDAA